MVSLGLPLLSPGQRALQLRRERARSLGQACQRGLSHLSFSPRTLLSENRCTAEPENRSDEKRLFVSDPGLILRRQCTTNSRRLRTQPYLDAAWLECEAEGESS